jgi:hypothetical protein
LVGKLFFVSPEQLVKIDLDIYNTPPTDINKKPTAFSLYNKLACAPSLF